MKEKTWIIEDKRTQADEPDYRSGREKRRDKRKKQRKGE